MDAKKSVFIHVNGIMTRPGDSRNWNGRATTWTHLHTPHRAEKLEYFTGPLFSRMIGQRDRIKKLATMIRYYLNEGWQVSLVGHSNGCGVIIGALKFLNWPRIEEIHLFAGACEADFRVNGLNLAQLGERIGRVVCYVSENDRALAWAASRVGQWFGYGALGRTGPKNFLPERTEVIASHDYGHSDWWENAEFEATMRMIFSQTHAKTDCV